MRWRGRKKRKKRARRMGLWRVWEAEGKSKTGKVPSAWREFARCVDWRGGESPAQSGRPQRNAQRLCQSPAAVVTLLLQNSRTVSVHDSPCLCELCLLTRPLCSRLSTRPRNTCALLLLMLMDASRPMWESDIALGR